MHRTLWVYGHRYFIVFPVDNHAEEDLTHNVTHSIPFAVLQFLPTCLHTEAVNESSSPFHCQIDLLLISVASAHQYIGIITFLSPEYRP